MGYYGEFPHPIPHLGVRSIALLTLSPLALAGTFDLHVLAMPPAFNLSHDQTLQLISLIPPCGGLISREEDHVTCSWPFRVTRKRSPGAFGGMLLPLIGMSGKFGFTRSPRTGRVEMPVQVLHESETGLPVKDEARRHGFASLYGLTVTYFWIASVMSSSKLSVCTDTQTPHSRADSQLFTFQRAGCLSCGVTFVFAAKSAGRDTKRSPSSPSSRRVKIFRRFVRNARIPLPLRPLRFLKISRPTRRPLPHATLLTRSKLVQSTIVFRTSCHFRRPPPVSPSSRPPHTHVFAPRHTNHHANASCRDPHHQAPELDSGPQPATQHATGLPQRGARRRHVIDHDDQTRPRRSRRRSPARPTQSHRARDVLRPLRLAQRALRLSVRASKPAANGKAARVAHARRDHSRVIDAPLEPPPETRRRRHQRHLAESRGRTLDRPPQRSAQLNAQSTADASRTPELRLQHRLSKKSVVFAETDQSVPSRGPASAMATSSLGGTRVEGIERLLASGGHAAACAVGRRRIGPPARLANQINQRRTF
jgi:hypothetical protein